MDLGITGKNAIIAASSAGLGFACAESLAKEGVNVVINGRDQDRFGRLSRKIHSQPTQSDLHFSKREIIIIFTTNTFRLT